MAAIHAGPIEGGVIPAKMQNPLAGSDSRRPETSGGLSGAPSFGAIGYQPSPLGTRHRDEEIRLECLRLAARNQGQSGMDDVARAEAYYDFVTRQAVRPAEAISSKHGFQPPVENGVPVTNGL